MIGNEVVVEKINHEDPAVARRLVDMLRPRETHALFLLGNLKNNYPDSHLYVARRGDDWLGVAGFYARPKSCSLLADDREVVGALIRRLTEQHPSLEMALGIDPTGRWAYEAMLELGFVPVGQPREVFMSMTIPHPLPPVPHEEKVRPIEDRDAMACARLQRLLDWPRDDSPIGEADLRRALANKMRLVLEVDGEVVSTATTNGLAIEAFQILGVATFPEHQRHGYATAVCNALTRRMKASGAKRCVLFTGPENLAAQRCYERLGFRIVGDYYMAKFRPPPRMDHEALQKAPGA